jgi:hypothetical protein
MQRRVSYFLHLLQVILRGDTSRLAYAVAPLNRQRNYFPTYKDFHTYSPA